MGLTRLTSAQNPTMPSGVGKLLLLILAAGIIATSLLVTRQQRVETAHELTTLHRQMNKNERALWEMRAAIAERCRPEAIRRMIDAMPDEWQAIPRQRRLVRPPSGARAAATPEEEPGG